MKFKINKKLLNFIIIFITILCIEIIIKGIRNGYLLNSSMLRILLSTSIISYIISTLVSKLNDKKAMTINLVISFIISFYAWLQIGLYRYVGTYMSFNNTSQGTKVVEFIGDFLANIPQDFYLIFIPFGLLLLINLYLRIGNKKNIIKIELTNRKSKYSLFKTRSIKIVVVLFSMYCYYLSLISPAMQSKYQTEKNIDLFIIPSNQTVAVNQFGLLVYGLTDFNNFIFKFESPVEEAPNVKPSKPIVVDDSRTIDDTLWEKIMSEETKSTFKNLNNYFISQRISPKNNYTGKFKDKNVIVIMMESVGMLGINEEYFPTLYKLWSEGISFSNFYSPRNSCPTGNNEMSAMTGLFSIADSCTANAYRNNNYPQAMFYKFSNQGYYASTYHNYSDVFYYRKDIHLNCGSEIYRNAAGLGIKNANDRNWPSDVELFTKGLPYFIDKDKFISYMTTVTTHASYDSNSEFGTKHLELFKDLEQPNSIKRYYSKLYELDLALKYLLDELTLKGKLDDTVIILFGDHQPYGLGEKKQIDILGEEAGINKNLEKTPLIIYNSKTKPEHHDTYASIIDILPTMLNLFDIEHDPRVYLGVDIFDEKATHKAIFPDGSWQDEYGYYNASNDTFIPNDASLLEPVYTEEEILAINTEVTLKLKMSTSAIRNDYFSDLKKKIEQTK